ncbi:MAG: hypothetical protein U0872_09465 [Planctomycetaceae bacterium]
MNWRQLQAILILRWQLSRNQWRRAGTFNAVLTTIASALMLVVGITGFFAALIGGSFLLPRAEPLQILILWDVLIVGFLFFWLVGLMTELQRSELLSLEKLLHLPLSLSGAFLLNYLSSWFSLSLGVFLPVLAGLCLAFLLTHGVRALLLWPLSIGFVVMITSVTYQLRGWLAQLMQNKRRRGTILTAITMAFLLLMQVPNIINMTVRRPSQRTIHRNHQEEVRQITQLTQELQNQQITLEEYNRRRLEIQNQQSRGRGIGFRPDSEELVFWLKLANLIVPIGWLPYGASALMESRPAYAVLCSAGMMAIGAGSLWRSYRSTLRAETASVGSVSRVAKRESTSESWPDLC